MNYYPFLQKYSQYIHQNSYINPQYLQKIDELSQLLNQKNNEIQTLKQQNQNLKHNVSELQTELEIQEKKTKNIRKPIKNYYRNNSVGGSIGENRLFCPYDDCNHHYSSILALNFHIKTKHSGGNKKQRQAYAKIIIQAQEKGQESPKINFNFPPGFLQKYRKNYFKAKQASTDLNNKFEQIQQ